MYNSDQGLLYLYFISLSINKRLRRFFKKLLIVNQWLKFGPGNHENRSYSEQLLNLQSNLNLNLYHDGTYLYIMRARGTHLSNSYVKYLYWTYIKIKNVLSVHKSNGSCVGDRTATSDSVRFSIVVWELVTISLTSSRLHSFGKQSPMLTKRGYFRNNKKRKQKKMLKIS